MAVGRAWTVGLLLVAGAAPAQMNLQEALQRRGAISAAMPVGPATPATPANLAEALAKMVSQAPVIFVGEVVTVREKTRAVEIEFHVETALRGAEANKTYTLREWPGLWVASDRRYRVGQRAIVLLHAPSAAGYSSPVGGGDGILPLEGNAVTGKVDLRWLATRVERSVAATGEADVRSTAVRPVAEAQSSQTAARAVQPDNLDCTLVLNMLRSLTAGQSGPGKR